MEVPADALIGTDPDLRQHESDISGDLSLQAALHIGDQQFVDDCAALFLGQQRAVEDEAAGFEDSRARRERCGGERLKYLG
jgi:hypothetical protein